METLTTPDFQTALESVYLIIKSNYKNDCSYIGEETPKKAFVQPIGDTIYHIVLDERREGQFAIVAYNLDLNKFITDEEALHNICNHVVTDYHAFIIDEFQKQTGRKL